MAAPSILNSSSANTTGGVTVPDLSWSHTVGAGTDRVLIVLPFAESGVGTPSYSGVTYGGVALEWIDTALTTEGSNAIVTEAWIMYDPPEGSASIAVTGATASQAGALALTIAGANQTLPEAVVKTNITADGTAIAQNITTATPDALVLAFAATNIEADLSIASGATEVVQAIGVNGGGGCTGAVASHDLAAAGAHTVNWTSAATYGRVSALIMSIVPAGTPVLTIADIANKRVIQRETLTTGDVPISGTAPGADSVEARIMQGATEVVGWTDIPMSGDSFNATLNDVPVGEGYHFEVRTKDSGGTVLLTRIGSNVWSIGRVILIAGSSTADRWFTDYPEETVPSALIYKFDGGWSNLEWGSAAIGFCNRLLAREPGVPIGLIDTGVSGSNLSSWAIASNSEYTACKALTLAAGGILEAIVCHVGSNDARNETVASVAAHELLYRQLITNMRADFASSSVVPALPVILTGCQRAQLEPSSSDVHWARARAAEQNVADDIGNRLGATVIDLILEGDQVHLASGDMNTMGRRAAAVYAAFMGDDVDWRGPKMTSVSYRPDTGIALVFFELLDGTSLCGRTSLSGITGFSYSTNGFASYTAITGSIIGTQVVQLNLPTGLSAVAVAYGYGTNPDRSNALFCNATAP
jgi:hypothetical protein